MSTQDVGRMWRAAPWARPLRAWSVAQLDALAAIVQTARNAWAHAWGIVLPQPEGVRCAAAMADEVACRSWTLLGRRGEAGAWIALWPGFEKCIARELFALEEASTPIVRAVVSACDIDLRTRIAAALHLQESSAAAALPYAEPWSGDVLVRLHEQVEVWVNATLLDALIKTPLDAASPQLPALAPIAQALENRRVDLQVTLGGCEIDVGTLRALQPGDVLPTEHSVSTLADVRAGTGQPVFAARLVRSGAVRAVELAPAAPTGTEEVAP